jgi:hypothetical protein
LPRAQRSVHWNPPHGAAANVTEESMSKGLDKKKEDKKKPAKSLKEKRAAKAEKKASKGR